MKLWFPQSPEGLEATTLEAAVLGFRVGRTARAGKSGQAFTLLLKVQVSLRGSQWEARLGLCVGSLGEARNLFLTPLCPLGEEVPADAGGGRGARAGAA